MSEANRDIASEANRGIASGANRDNPSGANRDRQVVLFIGGLGRSGTTLIEKLLNELPQTQAVGETVHLWERGVRDQERCGCGDTFSECAHWSAVGTEAFGSWDNVDLDRVIHLRWDVDRSRKLPQIFAALRSSRKSSSKKGSGGSASALRDEHREYLDYLRPVLQASAKVAGPGPNGAHRIILDSSKHLSTAAIMALDPALDVRVLHVLRDPRGVAHSWTKEIERPEAAGEDGAMMPTYKPSRTAMRWVTDNLGFDVLAKLGVPTLRLRYEDFLEDPMASMTAAANLAGVEGEDLFPMIDGKTVRLSNAMHSVAGNPMRFGGDDITLRLDDAWKTKLDPKAKATVTRITRPVLRRFGYEA